MTIDQAISRTMRVLTLSGVAAGLVLGAASTAQIGPPAPSLSYDQADPGEADAQPRRRAARPRTAVQPYLEVSQVLSADFNDGDVLTYTTVAAGVDGRVATRRVTAQLSYRYERNIPWNGDLAETDVHSGVALINAQVVPGFLNFDAGALATRTGGEGRALGVTDRDFATEVYSVYAGPTLSTRAGPVAVNASYRLGYVAVDTDERIAGGPREDFDDAVAHSATASVGMAPGRLPFGWTVGAGYAREESGELDHRFEGAYVRGDVVVPVSPTLALTAGVGYEDLQSTQRDILRNPDGTAVITPGGRLVADPNKPRLLAYDVDGLIYDAGVLWRPGPRTELQARAGHRYGGTTFVGSLDHRFNRSYGLSARVFDGVETFGRLLVANISGLPADLEISRNPFNGDLATGGCLFGADPGSGTCFDGALQSIRNQTFRYRGASLLLSGARGPWNFGLGASYAHRRFFQPVSGDLASLAPRENESFSLNGGVGRALSRTSEVNFDAYASWFDSDLAGIDPVFSTGATASYYRSFLLQRLQLLSALGIYHVDGGLLDSSTVGSARVGLRYNF